MKKRFALGIVISLLVIVTLACVSSGGGDNNGGDGDSGSGGGGSTRVNVVNNTDESICFIYISPSSNEYWGDDLLGASILSAGDSETFDMDSDTYDMLAEGCSGGVYEQWGINVSGSVDWVLQ